MNYYSHHIGDFDRATRHLTRTERSVYLDLIFVYYDTEQPLSKDVGVLCRKILARTEEEKAAVQSILGEFFVDTPAGWFHERCEEELDSYRKSNSQRSAAGKASAAARAARLQQASNGISTSVERDVEQPSNERSTNQEPITNNHKPKSRGTRLPENWHPTAEDTAYCKATRPELKPSEVATNFYDYWIAQPGQKGVKTDWSATWRSWVRKEKQASHQKPGNGSDDISRNWL